MGKATVCENCKFWIETGGKEVLERMAMIEKKEAKRKAKKAS